MAWSPELILALILTLACLIGVLVVLEGIIIDAPLFQALVFWKEYYNELDASQQLEWNLMCNLVWCAAVFLAVHLELMPSSKRRAKTQLSSSADDADPPIDGLAGLPELRTRILNFLAKEDLLTMRLVSKEFYRDCHHPKIEKKIGLVFKVTVRYYFPFVDHPISKLLEALSAARSKSRFSKYRHLRVSGANNYATIHHFDVKHFVDSVMKEAPNVMKEAQLEGIVSLDFSVPSGLFQYPRTCIPWALSKLLPNLRELDLSNLVTDRHALWDFARECPLLEKVTWRGNRGNNGIYLIKSNPSLCRYGTDLKRDGNNLKELYLDYAALSSARGFQPWEEDTRNFLFSYCSKVLERVSIRGTRTYAYDRTYARTYAYDDGDDLIPIPQEDLIKFVRRVPTLRWFRSDLLPENITMLQAELQAERPGIELLN